MNKRNVLLVVMSLVALQVCAQAPAVQISRLQLDYTAAAQKQVDDDARFNGSALRKSLGDVLTARGLANLGSDAVLSVAAIQIDEFDVRATSNVVLMGRVASAGVLGGTVRIRDGSGKALRELHVRAEQSFKASKKRADNNPLASLYQKFAEQVADELTGDVRPASR